MQLAKIVNHITIMGGEKMKEKILKEIENIKVIDAHEHLVPEKRRISKKLDIFALFSHYTKGDLMRAGMSEDKYNSLFNQDIPLEERWKKFYPYWEKIKYTSYSRSVLYTMEKFYGVDDLNEKNYREISEKVQERNKKGIYREVLRDTCNIEKALTQCALTDVDKEKDKILIPVMPITYIEMEIDYESFKNPLDWMRKYLKTEKIESIDEFLENMKAYFKKIKEEGAVGVKMVSYPERYPQERPYRKKAEEDFKVVKKGGKLPKINSLFPFLMDKLISFAIEENFVIAVHTGYWGDFRDLNPLHLIPVLERHPEGKFDVYHFGYPWIRETIMLGKGFSNVYLNFCWLHIISQKAAKEALDEVIETVPWNKIIGFGGDYLSEAVEKVYGHLKMAKEDIAEVIGKRIETGYMKYQEGIEFIRNILHTNPARLYNL